MTNILLTSTANNTTPGIITTLIVAVFIIVMCVLIYKKYKKDPDGEEKLKEFLDSIQEIIKTHIVTAINNFDFLDAKESFSKVQADFFEEVFDDVWELCNIEMEKLFDSDTALYILLKKVITRDKIEDYVLTVFSDDSIQDKLADIYNTALKDKIDQIEEEDKELEKEAEEYEAETVETEEVPDLDPMKIDGVEETIIPPVEEDPETVDLNDPTVEVLPESEQEDIGISLSLNSRDDV